ncbi:MAG TPA: ABC transporter permease subunit [Euzebyales bacterium]
MTSPGSSTAALGPTDGSEVGNGRPPRRATRPPWPLVATCAAISLVFVLPLVVVVVRAIDVGLRFDADSLAPAGRSLLLASTVAAATAVVGTAAAWLAVRSDLPARRLWAVLFALPLAIPSYIGAFCLQAAFATGGLVTQALSPLATVTFPRVEGFWAAFTVLTALTYPYVYLPVAARLRGMPPSHEESARLLGSGPLVTFRRLVLPQVGAAVAAGSLLVFLYVLSDFGAVQLLRYDTLTRVIFANQLDRQIALPAALQLSALALIVVVGERAVRRDPQASAHGVVPLQVPLRRWRAAAVMASGAVVGIGLVAPLLVLAYWVLRGLTAQTERPDLGELVQLTANTAVVSLSAAAVAVLVALPLAFLVARYRGVAAATVNAVVVLGFAVPGLVLALALVTIALGGGGLLAALYQTTPLLIVAYVIHFGAQALRSVSVGVAALPDSLSDAARLLGARRLRRLLTIELPLVRPSVMAGGGLVLLSVAKELPATLLLAPAGFATLATRIWSATEDAFWTDASVMALVLVAVSGLLTWLLVVRRADGLG